MKRTTHGTRTQEGNVAASWRHLCLLTSMVLVLFTTFITTAPAYAAPVRHTSDTTTAQSTPTTAPTTTAAATNTHPAPPNPHPNHGVTLPTNADTSAKHAFAPTMQPLDLILTPNTLITVRSSDHLLDVSVPADTLAATDVATLLGPAAPTGAVPHLIVTEIDPPSGSSNGGLISLGTYLFQLQDGKGHELASGKGLPHNITLTYHLPSASAALSLDHVVVSLNGALPMTTTVGHYGAKGSQPATLHPAAVTGKAAAAATDTTTTTPSLTASIPLTASSNAASFTSNAPEGYFAKPDTFQNDLHTGDLTTEVPLDIPTGPGGFTPPVHLAYSSAAVSATHNVQAAAPWVGDGWNLDLGEITWSESVDDAMPAGRTTANSWSISDPYGTSSALIPPSTNISTYWDDTSNIYYSNGTYANPEVQWHTAAESYAKIISYVGPNVIAGQPAHPPCWRVWLTNGIMEEFGCTADSLQWYPNSIAGLPPYVAAWKLDMIVDPNGNQIHTFYDQDMVTANGVSYPRDEVLNRVEWNSAACHSQIQCTGSSWAPLTNVTFIHSDTVTHVYSGARSCGQQANNLRCDDPAAAGGSINIGTPLLTQTQVLNDIQVNVSLGAGLGWHTLRNYQLAYDQGALSPNAIDDPGSGLSESVAGFLLLDQVQETGTDQTNQAIATGTAANAYPAHVFKYAIGANDAEYYEDSNRYVANQPTDCGYSWNTGNLANGTSKHGCLLWSRSYNGFYMTEADNGEGLQQTFGWQNMHTNQHDPASNYDWTDPTTCDSQQVVGATPAYPCDMPDDAGWSHIALINKTTTENSPTSANATNQTIGTTNYVYHLATLTSNVCVDCAVGMYWGNTNSDDYQDYYNGQFRGFAYVQQVNPDGSTINDTFYATEGWGVYDYTQVAACYNGHGGTGGCVNENSPASALPNAASGRLIEEDVTAPLVSGNFPLLSMTKTTWQAICPPSGVTASPAVSFTAKQSVGNGTVTMNLNWDGNRVAEQDPYNPMMVCDVQQAAVDTYTPNGAVTYANRSTVTNNNVPYSHVADTYDTNYGHLTQKVTTGNDLSSTPTITENYGYIWDDAISTTSTSASGTYIVDTQAFDEVHDPSGNTVQCTYHDYDGAGNYRGSQSSLTKGLETGTERYTVCYPSFQYANWTATDTGYNTNGDKITTIDADALHGVTGHEAATGSCTGFTACASYDSTYGDLPTTSTNVLNQTATMAYTTTAAYGYGQWPSSATDANGQSANTTFDVLGRTVTAKAPSETAAYTTQLSYDDFCALTGPAAPCLEVDTTQQLGGGTTVTKRDFYDGAGQHVESRAPAPGGQDVVQYALYDNEGRATAQSQPYFVTAYTGAPGAAAYSVPDLTKPKTLATYDALGRVTSATDPNGKTTTTAYSISCAPSGTNGDQACYTSTTTIDANLHQSLSYTDALGRSIYAQNFTGTSPYTLYRTTKAQYDVLGDTTSTTYADGTHQATATYDGLKRQTAFTDPDLGSYALSYDQNSNLLSSADPRGASGTVYLGYDGLNRTTWKSTSSTGSSPLATSTYDSTASGNKGIGRLTSETFASGPSQSVTGGYAYTYDARGQQTGSMMTLGASSYPFTTGYNDAGQATTLTYPDGDVVTTNYGAQDWLGGVTEAKSGTTNTLLNTLSYTGANGASQLPTSATVDNGVYSWNLSYDTDLRLKETKVTQISNSTTLFDQTRAFDAVGNVTSTNTTLPAGTDNQVFCYDEQNRLVWAGSTGTPTCAVALTAGSLNTGNVRYTQPYSYDGLNRLTTGPKGSGYTYGDTNHLDALTAAPSYTASYDTAGDMTGRSGNVLGYNALRQLITWQNQATSPTQTASYAYNGSGERVQQSVTTSGTTTTTSYIGTYEEVSVTGGTTTTTKYYSAGLATVVNVNGTLSYLVGDTLGSVSASLTASGGVGATELYTPYGSVRYSSGTMPTSYGYTKQRQDPSGLNYDHARYYDASVGQFISADVKQGPNRYGYVAGNPETLTDPTGNNICSDDKELCAPKRRPTPPPPTSPTTPTINGSTGGNDIGNSGSSTSPSLPPPPPKKTRNGNNPSNPPSGNTIFVDNNILILAFQGDIYASQLLVQNRILLIPEIIAEFFATSNSVLWQRVSQWWFSRLIQTGHIWFYDDISVRNSAVFTNTFNALGQATTSLSNTDRILASFAMATGFTAFTADWRLYSNAFNLGVPIDYVYSNGPHYPPPSSPNSGGNPSGACSNVAAIASCPPPFHVTVGE